MFAIADKVGKQTAHELVYEVSMHGIERGITFEAALKQDPRLRDALTDDELRKVLDPTTYVGLAPEIVERVLAEVCASGWLE
jgi:adenylosuccinate lyase